MPNNSILTKSIAYFGSGVTGIGYSIKNLFVDRINQVGKMLIFCTEIFNHIGSKPYRLNLVFKQMEFIGYQSFMIVFLSSASSGAVFGLQIGSVFKMFSAESFMGVATGLSLCWEIAPLITGVLLAGRAGSAMAAEIATMKVNEQVTAMQAMAVNPVSYLVVPRVIAATIMSPLLCGLFIMIGMIGAAIVGLLVYEIEYAIFMKYVSAYISSGDLTKGLFKATVFGFIVSVTCCFFGLNASGGAKGVGKATTMAVIVTLLVMLGFDFVITYFQFKYG